MILAFLAIGLGIRGTRWTWPFYFLSSLLYGWLFLEFDLFASAAMQLIFCDRVGLGLGFSWGREGSACRLGSACPNAGGALAVLALWALLAPLLQSIGGLPPGATLSCWSARLPASC